MGNRIPRLEDDLSLNDYRYLMKQTNLTPQVIQNWYREFNRACPTGELDKSQFKVFYQQLSAGTDRNLQVIADNVFRTFDRDGNNLIDFKEFLIAFTLTSNGDPIEKLNYTFSLFDEDGSETIDPDEMLDLLRKLFSITGCSADEKTVQSISRQIFDLIDVDQNRSISKEEFIDGCLKNPSIHKVLSPF